jgi:hypothetical protein
MDVAAGCIEAGPVREAAALLVLDVCPEEGMALGDELMAVVSRG